MSANAEKGIAIFQQYVGKEEAAGDWFEVTQERINQFADCTLDHQFIHVDPEKCKEMSPFGVPIAHGFLTLSMLTHLATSVKVEYGQGYAGIVAGVNYGFEKVRFPSPVKVNSRIRLVRTLAAAELKGATAIQLTHTCKIEIEGEAKPACVADWLTRLVYG
ncbi:MAG: MaoC family dehydratase [Myxococcales bacterium]|nr:MaoC family dehydratase [Myxococcales bacterium]MDD9969993.1 MaoC family dehydratase [Myxococcales bacterium]